MEKHRLTPENVRESSDSRKRLKVVYRGESNRKRSPELRRRLPEPEGMKTLETLAKAASDWRLINKQFNHGKGAEIFINFKDKNPLLASTMRNDLNQGTIFGFSFKNESWHFDINAIGTLKDNFEAGEASVGDGTRGK